MRTSAFAVALFCLTLTFGVDATRAQSPRVIVHAKSGRTWEATIDRQTDANRLWLRFESGRSYSLRPIQWQRVVWVQVGEERLNADDAAARVADLLKNPFDDGQQDEPARGAVEPSPPRLRPSRVNASATAKAIVADAWLANWDQDVESDGLVVQLQLIDGQGNSLLTGGYLEAELWSARRRNQSSRPRGAGVAVERVGRWARQLSNAELDSPIQLPFQVQHPDFQTAWGHVGVLRLRLAVPGHGVFETSIDAVRIREFSPTRDQLELLENRRFCRGNSSAAIARWDRG